jgi:hypothetical protein
MADRVGAIGRALSVDSALGAGERRGSSELDLLDRHEWRD